MKKEVRFHSKPSAFQQAMVFTICVLLLIVTAYIGANWLMGESVVDTTLRWIEELKSRQ